MNDYILYFVLKTNLNLEKGLQAIRIINDNCKLMNEKDAYDYLINSIIKKDGCVIEKDKDGVYSYSLNYWTMVHVSPLTSFATKFKLDECDWMIEENISIEDGYIIKELPLTKGSFIDCFITLDKLELFKECLIVPNIMDDNKILNFVYYAHDHKYNLLALTLSRVL